MRQLIPVRSDRDLAAVQQLFREYAASLPIDLGFQQFEEELAAWPGVYSPPRGALFLGRVKGAPVGCIGLRSFSESVGELKRLYVVPEHRGQGIARSLVTAAIYAARKIGYSALVLDTLASMHSAVALYESFGFQRIDAYYPNPLPDVLYFRRSLNPTNNS